MSLREQERSGTFGGSIKRSLGPDVPQTAKRSFWHLCFATRFQFTFNYNCNFYLYTFSSGYFGAGMIDGTITYSCSFTPDTFLGSCPHPWTSQIAVYKISGSRQVGRLLKRVPTNCNV